MKILIPKYRTRLEKKKNQADGAPGWRSLKGSQTDQISDVMEGFPESSEKNEQGMEDAEFHGEFENATYFLF